MPRTQARKYKRHLPAATKSDRDAVDEFLQSAHAACKATLDNFRTLYKMNPNTYLSGQIKYFEHAEGYCRSLILQNQQRRKAK